MFLFAVKKLKNGKEKTNVNTLCGEEVLITKKVTKFERGEAKAKNGVVWTTKSSNDEEIAEGQTDDLFGAIGSLRVEGGGEEAVAGYRVGMERL